MILDRRRFLASVGATSLVGCAGREPPAPARRTGPPHVELPPVLSQSSAGGSRTFVVEDHGVPLVSMAIVTGGGHVLEAAEHKGLASLSAALLLEGMDGGDRVQQLERYGEFGTTPDISVSAQHTFVYCTVHRDDAPAALRLLTDTLHRATVAEGDFERIRHKRRDTLALLRGAPDRIASLGIVLGTLGTTPPISELSLGTDASLTSLTMDQVRAWYAQQFRLEGTTFILAGDLRMDEGQAWVDAAAQRWPSAAGPRGGVAVSSTPNSNIPHNVLIPWPDIPQGIVAYGGLHAPWGDPREPAQTVARALVGSFMHHELRTVLRTSYGVQDSELYTTRGSVRLQWAKLENADVATAVQRLRERLERLQSELMLNEVGVDATRFSMMVGMMDDFHGPEAAMVQLLELADADLPPQTFALRLKALRELDADIVTDALRGLYDPQTLGLSVVADPDALDAVRETLPVNSSITRQPQDMLGAPA
ncbi:MAG: insulinase family protein [Myxococcota bacterium]